MAEDTFSTASSLSRLLRERIGRHARAGRTALFGPTGSTSYAYLGARIDDHANPFRGIARGALVGMPASRSADSVARFFGVMQAGGCPCFLEPGLTVEALLLRAHAVGLRQIVIEDESEATARALEHGGLQVRRATNLSPDARGCSTSGELGDESLTASDLAMMQFTTGSTGLPKGALLTHDSLLRHAAGIIERTALTAADRLLHVMPLHHTNGGEQPAHRTVPGRRFRGAGRALPGGGRRGPDRRLRRHLPDRRADDVCAGPAAPA